MKATFHGQLAEGMLVNLLQYLALNQASGCLRLRERHGAKRLGKVFFARGALVHAVLTHRQGSDALVEMAQWREGRFGFFQGVAAPEHNIHIPLERLLLHMARQQAASSSQPSPPAPSPQSRDQLDKPDSDLIQQTLNADAVLTLKPLNEQHTMVTLAPQALYLLRYINAERSLGEIAEKQGLSLATVLKAARALLRNDVVAITRHKTTVLEPAFLNALRRLAVHSLGPVADILLEERLLELSLSADDIPKTLAPLLIEVIDRHVQGDKRRAQFERQLYQLCDAYAIVYGGGV